MAQEKKTIPFRDIWTVDVAELFETYHGPIQRLSGQESPIPLSELSRYRVVDIGLHDNDIFHLRLTPVRGYQADIIAVAHAEEKGFHIASLTTIPHLRRMTSFGDGTLSYLVKTQVRKVDLVDSESPSKLELDLREYMRDEPRKPKLLCETSNYYFIELYKRTLQIEKGTGHRKAHHPSIGALGTRGSMLVGRAEDNCFYVWDEEQTSLHSHNLSCLREASITGDGKMVLLSSSRYDDASPAVFRTDTPNPTAYSLPIEVRANSVCKLSGRREIYVVPLVPTRTEGAKIQIITGLR